MAKTEVDWTALNNNTLGHSPFDLYGAAITAESERMQREIDSTGKEYSSVAKVLLTFSANSNPEDGFIRHAALFELLDTYGVLDAYFDPEDNKRAHFSAAENGWELWLGPKECKGAVRIFYSDVANDRIGKHVVSYIMPRPNFLIQ